MSAQDYKGFKLSLHLRAENLAAQGSRIDPFFRIRRAHGKVKTDKGVLDISETKEGQYMGSKDKASIVYDGSHIHLENTPNPIWEKVDISVDSLVENGDISQKIIIEIWDFSKQAFTGFLIVSIEELILYNQFVLQVQDGQGNFSPNGKLGVEIAELVPPGPYVKPDIEAARQFCGLLLYQASTGKLLDISGMDEVDVAGKAAGGWAYYDTVADKEGNITYSVFDKIITASLKSIFSGLRSSFEGIGDKILDSHFWPNVDPSVSDAQKRKFLDQLQEKNKIVESANKTFPTISKAIFRFFDIDGNGTIRSVPKS
jgi:hypothetical protein